MKEKGLSPAVEGLIDRLDLTPHPEGGFFRQSWVSPVSLPREALPKGYPGARPAMTSIYFLLPTGDRSRLHRVVGTKAPHGDAPVGGELGREFFGERGVPGGREVAERVLQRQGLTGGVEHVGAPRRVADVLLGGGRLGQLGGDPLTDGVGEARHGDGA